jgi:hypothetical protein
MEKLNFSFRAFSIKKLAASEHRKIENPEERKIPIAPKAERGMRAGILTASSAF